MVKKLCIIFLPLFLCTTPLLSDNHMDQIAHMQGEHGDARFGKYTASLDFNGDGYKDLVVRGGGSTGGPAPYYYGRLYFYFSSVNFNNQPDFTISSGDSIGVIYNHVANLGDVNNDGKEDLGFISLKDENYVLQILLGNKEQDSIPDFEMSFSENTYYNSPIIRKLGDINNDGYDDAGIFAYQSNQSPNRVEYYIIYGNNENLSAILFLEFGKPGSAGFSGVGDVNDDEFDDFCVGFRDNDGSIYYNRLYYGSEVIDTSSYVTLWEDSSTNMTLGLPAGDLNNDGYDDFVGHFDNNEINIWFGRPTITSAYNLTINGGYGGYTLDYGYDCGDLNADGYTDMVFGAPWIAMDCGYAFLYLGGANPNSTVDLELPWQDVGTEYGLSVSIGDFNMDGFDDVAIAGPTSPLGNGPGHVYVFAGNAELTDLYGIDDDPPAPDVMFKIHPNPFSLSGIASGGKITFSFSPQKPQSHHFKILIFNVKGERIETLSVENGTFTSGGSLSVSWDVKNIAAGMYYCKLVDKESGHTLAIKKTTVLQ